MYLHFVSIDRSIYITYILSDPSLDLHIKFCNHICFLPDEHTATRPQIFMWSLFLRDLFFLVYCPFYLCCEKHLLFGNNTILNPRMAAAHRRYTVMPTPPNVWSFLCSVTITSRIFCAPKKQPACIFSLSLSLALFLSSHNRVQVHSVHVVIRPHRIVWHAHTYIHTYTYKHTYTHTHIYTHSPHSLILWASFHRVASQPLLPHCIHCHQFSHPAHSPLALHVGRGGALLYEGDVGSRAVGVGRGRVAALFALKLFPNHCQRTAHVTRTISLWSQ